MAGFTVVLIDDEDGSEGDFVFVESFPDLESLREDAGVVTASSWTARIVRAATEIDERDRPQERSYIYRGIE
jgi:hypothetical protein